jgi:glycosyltransferase involved in cell wall biosynthesis
MNNPKVSVCMITYGHEKFIREAIEGVLMQVCDFQVELVIANDCSPDATDTVIQDILQKHPRASWISYIKHEKNIGMMANFIFAMKQCSGKYIALCEGDDYWTDPLKLQQQLDFLEGNPDFSFSFHDCEILNQISNTKTLRIGNRKIDEEPDLKSIIIENNIPTASLLFVNIDWNAIPNWIFEIEKGDYGLVILLGEKGNGKYMPEPMSVYRIHEGGVWSSKSMEYFHEQNSIFYNFLLSYFKNRKIKKVVKMKINIFEANHGIHLIRNGKIIEGTFKFLLNRTWFKNDSITFRKILSAYNQYYFSKSA